MSETARGFGPEVTTAVRAAAANAGEEWRRHFDEEGQPLHEDAPIRCGSINHG